ncbi:hypothetical protein N5P37_009625 [Trichoderma harzianum]|nr:hypothetical protein N5P37_009625 [Trichoderma harzianum]
MDPNPSNPSFQYNESTRTGGKELIDELGEAIDQNRVVDMARLFLQTCPGEENRGWYHLTNAVLENAARGLPDDEELSMAHSGSAMAGYDGGGFVKAEETMERLDGRQMLFDNTSGDANHWASPIHVYLNINDVPISTPDPKDADTFCCISSDSLDVTFAMHGTPLIRPRFWSNCLLLILALMMPMLARFASLQKTSSR